DGEERALARAVRTQHGPDLAGRDLEVDPPQHLALPAARPQSADAQAHVSVRSRTAVPRCWSSVSAADTSRTSPSRRIPIAIANEYPPPLTAFSAATASVWVEPKMLPPTIASAPTSLSAEPIAAIAAANTPTLPSRSASAATCSRPAPKARA